MFYFNRTLRILPANVLALSLVIVFASFFVPSLTSANPVSCAFESEEASQLNKTLKLDKFGIAIDIPVNYRAIGRTNGSVQLVDNGTYQGIACFAKNPTATGGSGYTSLLIYKSRETFLYSNVQNKVPNKENIFLVVKKNPLDQSYQYYVYEVKLRMKTKKGFIELEYLSDEPIEDTSVENIKDILLKVAENIQIL
jgi:hypothetical protein